jgi:hypothetical protein
MGLQEKIANLESRHFVVLPVTSGARLWCALGPESDESRHGATTAHHSTHAQTGEVTRARLASL